MRTNCVRNGQRNYAALLIVGWIACLPLPLSALQNVKLAWDPSAPGGITNYNIYYWQQNGAVTNKQQCGCQTNATITGLVEGRTYLFKITANGTLGLESTPSVEISYTVPVPVLQMQAVRQGGRVTALNITATGGTPVQWTLECSTNLLSWSGYAAGTNTAVSVQVPATTAARMFFRLKNQ